MKKIHIILIGLYLIVFLYSCKDVQKEYYPNGEIRSEIELENGIRNGVSKWYHNNGTLEMEVYFINDKEQGKIISYYDNGKINTESYFLNGIQEGTLVEYYPSGILKSEQNFKKGKQHGTNKYYHYSGNLLLDASVEEGVTIFFEEFDSLGNWIDEYRWIDVIIEDTVSFGKDYQVTIDLKGPKVNLEDSVLCFFSIHDSETNEMINDKFIRTIKGNRFSITFETKKIGKFTYTGMIVTNLNNNKKKEHKIPNGTFYILNSEPKIL